EADEGCRVFGPGHGRQRHRRLTSKVIQAIAFSPKSSCSGWKYAARVVMDWWVGPGRRGVGGPWRFRESASSTVCCSESNSVGCAAAFAVRLCHLHEVFRRPFLHLKDR